MVEAVYLFDLASRQAQWLSVRQATVAGNISNADTPGYEAREVQPFVDVLDKTQLAMAASARGHVGPGASALGVPVARDTETWNVSPSGNSVSMEEELIRANDINRGYSLNTAIVGAFHRMLITAVKG